MNRREKDLAKYIEFEIEIYNDHELLKVKSKVNPNLKLLIVADYTGAIYVYPAKGVEASCHQKEIGNDVCNYTIYD